MKKLLIVSLGVCMLGTACSRDTNRIEENTLQQSQEQSVILQTETEEFDIPATKESSLEQEVLLALEEPSETAGLSEAEYMEEPTEASEERIEQLLKQAETDADQDRYYIVEAIDNEEANKRDTDAKLFIKEKKYKSRPLEKLFQWEWHFVQKTVVKKELFLTCLLEIISYCLR